MIHLPAGAKPINSAEEFIEAIQALISAVKLPTTLRELNVPESDLPMLAKDALLQQRLLMNNPRVLTEADALMIYHAAY